MSGTVRPFTISVADEAIGDLHRRIDDTRWPTAFTGDWSDGADLGFVRELTDHWRHRYDWRANEAALNRHDQVVVDVDGVDIHAIHRRGVGPDPMPLVLTHGWPSSVVEWRHVIDALADPGAHGGDPADAFHVVAPSLPGYGFSAIAPNTGTTPRSMAAMWQRLMTALGYERFGAHGCDWGAYITTLLGLDHPESVIGMHLGMVALSGPRTPDQPRTDEETSHAARSQAWRAEEFGYHLIQGTKPQTLAYGLTDSPVGLAAWIVEKWRGWSDCGGDLYSVIDRDDVLTNIAIYWFTGTINSANRLYRENRLDPVILEPGQKIPVPAGFLLEASPDERPDRSFAGDARPVPGPRSRAERVYDIERWTTTDRGSHFPALETPDLLVDEIRAFFGPHR